MPRSPLFVHKEFDQRWQKSMQRVDANAGREGDAGCRKQQWAVKLRCWAVCQAHLTWKQQLPLNASPTSPKPGESQSPRLTSETVPKHKQYFYTKIPVQAHSTSSHARRKPAAVHSRRFVHCLSETTAGTKEPLLGTSEVCPYYQGEVETNTTTAKKPTTLQTLQLKNINKENSRIYFTEPKEGSTTIRTRTAQSAPLSFNPQVSLCISLGSN